MGRKSIGKIVGEDLLGKIETNNVVIYDTDLSKNPSLSRIVGVSPLEVELLEGHTFNRGVDGERSESHSRGEKIGANPFEIYLLTDEERIEYMDRLKPNPLTEARLKKRQNTYGEC